MGTTKQKMVRITAKDKHNQTISEIVPVHADYTGPETYDLGRVADAKELRAAFNRYCDAV